MIPLSTGIATPVGEDGASDGHATFEAIAGSDGAAPEVFLQRFFSELAKAKVRYCVMRNYRDLPHSVGTSDLDILLEPNQLKLAERALSIALEANGGAVIAKIRARSLYLKTLGHSAGCWWGLAIDLVADVDYQGMVYSRANSILAHAQDHHGIKVAAPEDAAVMGMVKEVINNLTADDDYLQDARQAVAEHGAAAERGIQEFHVEVRRQFVDLLAQTEVSTAELHRLGLAMRADLRRQNYHRLPVIALSELWHRLLRVFKRPGPTIAITGTDGSGKSTLQKSIMPVLNRAFHKRVLVEHLRPNWMPPLGVALGKRPAPSLSSPVTDPHAKPADGFIKSLLRMGYYYLDYSIGYYVKIFPLLVGRCHIVCFDRYYYDIIVDPRRMRIGLPTWVLRLTFSFAPAPDLLLCLGGDPAEIYRRKPETSEAEVRRQVEALQKICRHSRSTSVWVDTTCSMEDSRTHSLRAIRDTFGYRNRK